MDALPAPAEQLVAAPQPHPVLALLPLLLLDVVEAEPLLLVEDEDESDFGALPEAFRL